MAERVLPNVHLVCTRPEHHFPMSHVKIIGDYAEATDGYWMVRMRINNEEFGITRIEAIEEADGKLVPGTVWQQMQKATKIVATEDGLVADFEGEASLSVKYATGLVEFSTKSVWENYFTAPKQEGQLVCLRGKQLQMLFRLFGAENLGFNVISTVGNQILVSCPDVEGLALFTSVSLDELDEYEALEMDCETMEFRKIYGFDSSFGDTIKKLRKEGVTLSVFSSNEKNEEA